MNTCSRVDLHCHSSASEVSKLGVQRALGLPECATPPEDVLELATRRGMQFVTITDHDTIDGVLSIADDPRVFVSEELTAWFKGEPQAVHILCYGITPDDHEWLQAHSRDVERCAEYLHQNEITTALAHPFFAVAAPLETRHRRTLAKLFPIWEVRNGSRARERNAPAANYIDTHGGIGIGGSDDHAGVDIGRTFTETPPALSAQEFLAHIRAGRAEACGKQGSAAKWAHAAMGLAVRTLGTGEPGTTVKPDPRAVWTILERVMREGSARGGETGHDLGPDDARALMRSWLDSVGLQLSEPELLAYLQEEGFGHGDLYRRARRSHERALARSVKECVAAFADPDTADPRARASALFDACLPAVPYVSAATLLGREKRRLNQSDGEPRRVALVADGVGGMHGVTHTLDEIQDRGVPGFEVEVVGTDSSADRRLSSVVDVEVPFYAGLEVGVPALPQLAETLSEGNYDLVHICSPGPAGLAATAIARIMELPTLGSYHTDLAAYATVRAKDSRITDVAQIVVAGLYGQCGRVLSPSVQSDEALLALGIPGPRIGRWDRGVDTGRFNPMLRDPALFGGGERINVLYVGRQTKEKGADLLAGAFLAAHAHNRRLHLVLAGGGPEHNYLRQRLGNKATFLGWQYGDELATTFASADVLLFPSRTDTFGQVLLEAQASGLPVIAVDEGGPRSIVQHGVTGMLAAADIRSLSETLLRVAAAPDLRARLAVNALPVVQNRTWEASLEQLARGYRELLAEVSAPADLVAA